MIETANEHNHPGVAAVKQMIDLCDLQIAGGHDFVYLVVGKRTNPGQRIRLTPVGGPTGEFRCVNIYGECVGLFNPEKVAAYLRKGAREVGVIL